jgi:hypothetical protein
MCGIRPRDNKDIGICDIPLSIFKFSVLDRILCDTNISVVPVTHVARSAHAYLIKTVIRNRIDTRNWCYMVIFGLLKCCFICLAFSRFRGLQYGCTNIILLQLYTISSRGFGSTIGRILQDWFQIYHSCKSDYMLY